MAVKLIINADDLGVSPDIDRGIMDCRTKGVLTDMSMLACGENFEGAAAEAKKSGINTLGVHLALTGGFSPVSQSVHAGALVDRSGRFPPEFHTFITAFMSGRIKKEDVYSELKAQVKKVKEAGFKVSHVDSHQHVHMFSELLRIVIRVMKEEGLSRIRYPKESISYSSMLIEPINAVRHMMLGAACFASLNILKSSGLVYNDAFAGQFHAHSLNEKDMFALLKELSDRDGTIELGCHPGYFGKDIAAKRPWYKDCEEEVRVLCDGKFRQEIEKADIKLISWGEV